MLKALCFIFLAVFTSNVSAENKIDNFRVGITVPLTGDFASYGQQIRSGAELAQEDLLKQGIGLELLFENACLPSEAITSLTRLSTVQHIQGLENFCNIALPAMAPIIQKNQIPTFAVGGASDDVLELGGYVFTTDVKVRTEARKIAEYAANSLKVRTVSILNILTQFGEDYRKHFTARFEELGGKVISSDPSAIGVNDFRAELLNIKRKQPEMIFAVHLGSSLGVLLRQARDVGLKQQIMGSYEAGDASVLGLAKENANGLRFFLPMPQAKTPTMLEYEAKFKSKFNSQPGILESAAYDATILLGQSLKECDGNGPCIKDALVKRHTYDGVSGHFSLISSEESQREYTLQEIIDQKISNAPREN